MRKIVVIGGVAGGASAAARLRRLSEEDEIVMFERGPHISFSNCCLPYHLSGMIDESQKLVLMTSEKIKNQYNIDARVNSEVLAIDKENKKVSIKNTVTGEIYEEKYDKLVLSPGAKPIVPNIKGMENVNVFTIRNVVDIDRLNRFIKETNKKNVTVIGGGFIGIEAAENLKEAGYNVTLVEASNQILRNFDYDMVQILHKEIYDKGVDLIVEDKVVEFEKDTVVLESGKKIEAEAVVLAIGVAPEISLAKEAGLEIGKSGAIKVNQNYLTSDKDIYAVGDAIEVYNPLFNDYFKLALAGPAQKEARLVADHINGMRVDNRGYIGSSCIKVFGYNGASTGLTEGMIKARNMSINYGVVDAIPMDSVKLMPTARPIYLKVIYEIPTGRVLGAQAIGQGNVTKRIDVIATVIKFGGTVDDLKDLELCYAPPFGTAKDPVNYTGYIATNLLQGTYEQISYSKTRELVESGAYILDVREDMEYAEGHLKCAKHIPLSQLRDRIDELPRDKEIVIHCKSGQRSYNACLLLKSKGFKALNLTGGFTAICNYEYFNDIRLGREPIYKIIF